MTEQPLREKDARYLEIHKTLHEKEDGCQEILKTLRERPAAKYLGVSYQTLQRSRLQGARKNCMPPVPYVQLGRNILYRISDLDEYLAQHRVVG